MSSRAPGAVPRSRPLATGCGVFVLLLGITVLTGWCCHASRVERIVSGLPVMTALTASGLSLGGAAMLCLSTRRGRWAGRLLAALMATIGLLVLFEYAIAPLGIDQLLFRASPSSTYPGRPSPQTSVCLLFLGSALASIDLSARRRWLHYGLLAGTAVVVLFVTVGYLFGVVALRGVSGSDGVALPTLVGLIVLAVGTASLLPDSGIAELARGRGSSALVARAALALGLAPVIVGAVLLALMGHGSLEPRVTLTLFTVAMIVLLAVIALPLVIKMRRAEADSRRAAGQLQALFDNAPAALSMRGADGRYLHINRYGAEILGVAPEELVGRHPGELDQGQSAAADDREIARSRASMAHEQRVGQVDGSQRDFYVIRYPVLEDGELRGVGTFAVDITAQKRTIAELELAQNRFRSAFDEAPIGMMLQALDGAVQQVNPALCQLVGRSAEELLELGIDGFVAEEDRLAEATARAQMRNAPARSVTLELHYESADGQRIPVDVHLTLVRGSDQSPLHYIVQVQDATARRRHEQRLEFLADHDPLTSLLNRRAFLRRLERRQRHRDEGGAVIVLDLDSLKAVNDAHGHHAGDELIIRAATISRSQLRATDVVARLGGDEFAVLLPGTSPESAADVAHHLLAALNAHTDVDGRPVRPIRASVGVTCFLAPMTETPAMILQRADFAMYEAKREGGNRVACASVTPAALARLDPEPQIEGSV